jgi:2'-5' RNA ligase
MRAFLFAFEIEPVQLGASYDSLPLHCTLMHWFRTRASADTVIRLAHGVMHDRKPVELNSREFALFGRNKNIPVHTIEMNTCMHSLHMELFYCLRGLHVTPSEPEYIGAGWKPHVTTKDGRAFAPGSRTVSKAVYLVQALDARALTYKRVIAKFSLA